MIFPLIIIIVLWSVTREDRSQLEKGQIFTYDNIVPCPIKG